MVPKALCGLDLKWTVQQIDKLALQALSRKVEIKELLEKLEVYNARENYDSLRGLMKLRALDSLAETCWV
jgi:hypothetical protein